MTSKDKTRDKLVGSMRKTKAIAGIGSDSAVTENASAAPGLELKVESAAESKSAEHGGKKGGRGHSASSPVRSDGDPYQRGRRVWPD